MNFLVQLAIAIVLAVISYALMPKPKPPKQDAASDLEAPTADAGRPIPVIFGDVTIKSPNCLGYWDISTTIQKVKL